MTNVMIFGLGETGVACVRWLARQGLRAPVSLQIVDSRDNPAGLLRLPELAMADKGCAAHFTQAALPFPASLLEREGHPVPSLIVVSPGLRPKSDLQDIMRAAAERQIPVCSEIELFALALQDLSDTYGYRPKVLAITGTNGKTTVTRLTTLLCERAGKKAVAGGNVSPAVLEVLCDALEKCDAENAWDRLAADALALSASEVTEVTEVTVAPVSLDLFGTTVVPGDDSADQIAEEAVNAPLVATVAVADTDGPTEPEIAAAIPLPVARIDTGIPAALKGLLPDVWVLELSSFQLHTTRSLNADAATVLNITQDHLDWHGTMARYVADKGRIFGPSTVRVLNRDDALSMTWRAGSAMQVHTFGSDFPEQPDAFGLLPENGISWLAVRERIPDGSQDGSGIDGSEKKRRRRPKAGSDEEIELTIKRLMPVDALKIRGHHNALNALAALALCRAIKLPLAPLLHALRDYRGEPHRTELIATIGDVQYIDDGKGTNVGATVAALNGLGQPNQRHLVLLVGGDGKGQDFTPLATPVARFAHTVILYGRDAQQIVAAISDACAQVGVPVETAGSLEAAVTRSAEVARPGDCVLLSPACASFDMFRSYLHRSQVFADAVREVALNRGEVMA